MAHTDFRKIALNYGLLFGGISLLIFVIQYALGDYSLGQQGTGGTIYTIISIAVGVVVAILGMQKLKQVQGGFLSFGEGFKLGFSIYIYSALVGVLWILLYTLVLEPGYQEDVLEASMEQMYEQNPNMGDEELEMAATWTERFTSPISLIIFTILSAAFFGAIISAIIAAFVKKNRPAYYDESETALE